MYDPTTGRFVSKDAVKDDPLNNPYRYVRNNPINKIDPSGQQTLEELLDATTSENDIIDLTDPLSVPSTFDIVTSAAELEDQPPGGNAAAESLSQLLDAFKRPVDHRKMEMVPQAEIDRLFREHGKHAVLTAQFFLRPVPPPKPLEPWDLSDTKRCICAALDAPGEMVEDIIVAIPQLYAALKDRPEETIDAIKSHFVEVYEEITAGGEGAVMAGLKLIMPYTAELVERLSNEAGKFILSDPKAFCGLLVKSAIEIGFFIYDFWLIAPRLAAKAVTRLAKLASLLAKTRHALGRTFKQRVGRILFGLANGDIQPRIRGVKKIPGIKSIEEFDGGWIIETDKAVVTVLRNGSGFVCHSCENWFDDIGEFILREAKDLELDVAPGATADDLFDLIYLGRVVLGELDGLGRPTGIRATITKAMLRDGSPPSKNIKPPGFLGGAAGHARGHLLGAQLGGTGKDARNLVTLFQTMNNSSMKQIEGQVRRAVEAGEIVEYTVTPIYRGQDLIPRGVTISAVGNKAFRIEMSVINRP